MADEDLDEYNRTVYTNEADLIIIDKLDYHHHVSTEVLSSASPVFRAMFRPGFTEGQGLLKATRESLPVIRLPDDISMELGDLFSLLHRYRLESIGKGDTSGNLPHLGEIVDKYQCLPAVAPYTSFVFKGWDIKVRSTTDNAYHPDDSWHNCNLIEAAFLLDNAEYFQKYSNILVRAGLHDDVGHHAVTDKAEAAEQALYKRHSRCRVELLHRVARVVEVIAPLLLRYHGPDGDDGIAWDDFSRKYDYAQRVASRYLEEFVKRGLWPVNNETPCGLQSVLDAVKGLTGPDLREREPCEDADTYACHLWLLKPKIDPEIRKLQEFARDMWAGVCLDCCKNGGKAKTSCRIPHERFSLKG